MTIAFKVKSILHKKQIPFLITNMIKKITFFYSILFVATIWMASCTSASKDSNLDAKNDIQILETDNITLHKGETFTIKLNVNGSIGSGHCWINEGKCHSVKEDLSWYVMSSKEKKRCIGCGRTIYWTFKAVTQGTDTIKIKHCPTGRMQKSCSAFQEDSLAYKEDLKYAPRKYDKAIIVHVVR
jgi:predicted secreted protein